MEEIIKMIDEAFEKGHLEEDDMKRASIYGKCLSKVRQLLSKNETDTKQG